MREAQIKGVRYMKELNPLSANPTKWSNTLKQFIGDLPTKCVWPFCEIGAKRVNKFISSLMRNWGDRGRKKGKRKTNSRIKNVKTLNGRNNG